MNTQWLYLLAADSILLLHSLFVVFVIFGLLLIVAGRFRHWRWIRNPWFRALHLLAITVVTVQALLGAICPLTSLEMALRSRAGDSVYAGSFMAHWLQEILYYDLPLWAFAVCYTLFCAVVLASWYLVPPRRFSGHAPRAGRKP